MKYYPPKSRIFSIIVLIGLLLAACSPAATPSLEMERSMEEAGAPAPAAEPMYDASGSKPFGSQQQAQIERIVIKNASLTLVVNDPPESMSAIAALADEMGGFVVSANAFQTRLESGAEVPEARITIRVPAEKLTEALEKIKEQGIREPISEDISSQDVTMEYTDLQSRLRNLESAEAQLSDIMDDAVRTEDVLNVYNQLVSVREQIEVIKGQINYYEQSAALSAISVSLKANAAVQPLTIGGWQPAGEAKDAVQALINTLKFLVNAIIWIGLYILPVLLVLFFVFFLPLRWIWRKLRGQRLPKKAAVPPPAA